MILDQQKFQIIVKSFQRPSFRILLVTKTSDPIRSGIGGTWKASGWRG